MRQFLKLSEENTNYFIASILENFRNAMNSEIIFPVARIYYSIIIARRLRTARGPGGGEETRVQGGRPA